MEETIHAMQRTGVGNLQVSVAHLISSEIILSHQNKAFLDVR